MMLFGESMTLAKVKIGETAKVVSVKGESNIAKRLMEMGIVPGVNVRVVKTAPLGCPLEINVRGYHLALRKSEAESIEVSQ